MKRWMRWTLPLLAALILAMVAARAMQARKTGTAVPAAAGPASAASGATLRVLEVAGSDLLRVGRIELARELEVSGTVRAVNSAFVKARVAAELTTTFKSHYARQVSLADALSADMIKAYGQRATGEKFLITPNPAA